MIFTQQTHTLQSLASSVKAPAFARRYWRGIPHADLLRLVQTSTKKRGWTLYDFKAHIARNGDMTCSWLVQFPIRTTTLPPAGPRPALGIINSNTQRSSIRLFGGVSLLHPPAGIVLTEWDLGRHTKNFDRWFPPRLAEALLVFHRAIRHFPPRMAELQRTIILPTELGPILAAAGRQGLLPWSRLGAVERGFRAGGLWNHWALLEQLSLMGQRSPPLRQLRQLHGFYALLQPGRPRKNFEKNDQKAENTLARFSQYGKFTL